MPLGKVMNFEKDKCEWQLKLHVLSSDRIYCSVKRLQALESPSVILFQPFQRISITINRSVIPMKNATNTQRQSSTHTKSMREVVFGENGMLHTAIGDKYEKREGQIRMAVAVGKAIMSRSKLLCEGATGIGKSFGYLIPAFSPATRKAREAIEGEGKPIILSTSTKILQDQLIETDVPLIRKATNVDLKVHIAKGRNNYMSWRRLENFQSQLADNTFLFDHIDAAQHSHRQADALADWWKAIVDNNLDIDGEFVNFTPEKYKQVLKTDIDLHTTDTYPLHREIISAVQSDHNDCLGKACPNYDNICPYYTKRRDMGDADLIIANHTLLALHLRQNILPEANTYIIDEAHKFYSAVSSVFQIELSLQKVKMFTKAILNKWNTFKKEAVIVERILITKEIDRFTRQIGQTINIATKFFDDYHAMLHQTALYQKKINDRNQTYPYVTLVPFDEKLVEFVGELQKYVDYCNEFAEIHFAKYWLEETDDQDEDIDEKDNGLYKDWQLFSLISKLATDIVNDAYAVLNHTAPKTHCYWADIAASLSGKVVDGNRVKLIRTPIDITAYLEPLFAPDNSVILTSATLTTGQQGFNRLKTQLGLQHYPNVSEMVEPSPFPLKQNAAIHLFPTILLPPTSSSSNKIEDAYFEQQATLCEYYLRLNHGRALVLCTSRYYMDRLYQCMEPVFEDLGVQGLIQSTGVNLKELLSDFVSDETSILFGVDSCWEGLDAPGDTLKTVVITRLPFSPPHPVTEARIRTLQNIKQGFWEVQLPDMLLRLKQGAGRLIRSTTDIGVIAILDPRAVTKSYSKDIIKSLPPANIVYNPKPIIQHINNL